MENQGFPENDFRAPVPVVGAGQTNTSLTDKLTSIVFTKYTPKAWFAFMGVGFMLVMGLLLALTWLRSRASASGQQHPGRLASTSSTSSGGSSSVTAAR